MKSLSNKILIRTPNWLGDAILSFPAIEAIHRCFPEYEISILTLEPLKDLYELHPLVSSVFLIDKSSGWNRFKKEWHLAKEMKKEAFEISFIFPSSFRSALIPFFARIPVRIGYRKNGRSFLLTHSFPIKGDYKRKIHQSRFSLDLLEKFSKASFDATFSLLCIPEDLKARVLKKLEKEGFSTSNLIGLAPGAEYGPAKQWPLINWHMLTSQILFETDYTVVITGTEKDKKAADFLKDETKGRVIDMTGKLTLNEFFALISLSTAFVANDSGAMHAATAVGKPVVGLFGSTCPTATSPVTERCAILYKALTCSPCFERECPLKHYRCLTELEPEEVFDALKTFI